MTIRKILKQVKIVRNLSIMQFSLQSQRNLMVKFIGEGKVLDYDSNVNGLENLTEDEIKKFYGFDDYDKSMSFYNSCAIKSKILIDMLNEKILELTEFSKNEETLFSLIKTTSAFVIIGAILIFICSLIINNLLPIYVLAFLLLIFAIHGYAFHNLKCFILTYLTVRCEQFLSIEKEVAQDTFEKFLNKINSN